MRKITLLTGVLAMTLGLSAVSSSAFAMGCLANQEALPPISLSQTAMTPNAGYEYDKAAYDAELVKGNTCPTTQQSQPVSNVYGHATRDHARTYN